MLMSLWSIGPFQISASRKLPCQAVSLARTKHRAAELADGKAHEPWSRLLIRDSKGVIWDPY